MAPLAFPGTPQGDEIDTGAPGTLISNISGNEHDLLATSHLSHGSQSGKEVCEKQCSALHMRRRAPKG